MLDALPRGAGGCGIGDDCSRAGLLQGFGAGFAVDCHIKAHSLPANSSSAVLSPLNPVAQSLLAQCTRQCCRCHLCLRPAPPLPLPLKMSCNVRMCCLDCAVRKKKKDCLPICMMISLTTGANGRQQHSLLIDLLVVSTDWLTVAIRKQEQEFAGQRGGLLRSTARAVCGHNSVKRAPSAEHLALLARATLCSSGLSQLISVSRGLAKSSSVSDFRRVYARCSLPAGTALQVPDFELRLKASCHDHDYVCII